MASSKSAEKSARVSERNRIQNRPIKSAVKTQISKTLRLIASQDMEAAQAAAVVAISTLDKAAQKGVIHPNNAARRKSRLMHKLNPALASAQHGPASE